ncbi:MAG: PEP-CTERM sorting domain-containing protein [Verrucomicrobiae bacterium]|nr:PEP-CTERM sorting domain-containing protein [Verrucomicrobiae bacterium]
MKLTTPLKIFLSVALLAGGAQAASLSLGALGLTQGHSVSNPAGTLQYFDPSGIVITYSGQPQSNYVNSGGTRGWNNDPNPGITGFSAVSADHLAIAHFGDAGATTPEKITLDFSTASGVNLSSVRLKVWDLDSGGGFTESLTISGNPTLVGHVGDDGGTLSYDVPLTVGGLVTITPNMNPGANQGLSAFTVTWDAVPEPSTGLLALLGSSVLFLRRRR